MPRGRGLGMACSHYVSGSAKPVHWSGEPHAVVNLRLDFDGAITVLTGAADIGQGSSTLLSQIVAEVLGVPMVRVRIVAADSALTPKDNGSYSSRVSFMVGNAALRAAQELLRVLVAAAAKRLGVEIERIEWLGEGCRVVGEDRGLDFAAVVAAALAESGTLTVKGTWSTPPETQGGKHRGGAVGSTAGFSYAAQVVEVSVDEETGPSPSRRSGSRTIAASRSTRSPSKARCRAPSGWEWARRCRRKRSTTKASRSDRTSSTTWCRRSPSRRRSRSS
jgi:Aerobic-type carbon monoxide dehydrogenase, large subunit CoxL/CutL homologs